MLKANFHTHSVFCDGTSSPRQMVERALELGFTALGFSGHVDIDPVMDIEAYQKEIRALATEYGDQIEILCGGEVDTFFSDPMTSVFDYKIGSNHHVDVGAESPIAVDHTEDIFLNLLNDYYQGNVYDLCGAFYERVAKVYDQTHCTFVGHFDLVTKYNDHLHLIDEDDPRYVKPAMDALDYLLSEGVAFEINTRMVGAGRIYPHKRFLKRIREAGAKIVISSDAHNAAELNKGFDEAVELARSCGIDYTYYLSMKSGKLEFVPIKI